jgi:TonB-dependent SusC/RagA subfamily outer membrane receptor
MNKAMKDLIYMLLLIAGLSACATSQSASDKAQATASNHIEISQPLRLSDFLIRVPGVYVDELGTSTRVLVRGRVPLFVVDGVRVGFSYQQVEHLVNVNDIASVEVLKGPGDTAMYGRQGANGVIVIRTKT